MINLNKWTKDVLIVGDEPTTKNKDISSLINSIIPDKRIILFGMLETLLYRGCYIGLSESAISKINEHSYKCQVHSEIAKIWTGSIVT